jgi:hypothetical protein
MEWFDIERACSELATITLPDRCRLNKISSEKKVLIKGRKLVLAKPATS